MKDQCQHLSRSSFTCTIILKDGFVSHVPSSETQHYAKHTPNIQRKDCGRNVRNCQLPDISRFSDFSHGALHNGEISKGEIILGIFLKEKTKYGKWQYVAL